MPQVIAYGVIRADANGDWYLLNDAVGHQSFGFDLNIPAANGRGLVQTHDGLLMYLSPVMSQFGSLSIVPDDGFGGSVVAGASGGLQAINTE